MERGATKVPDLVMLLLGVLLIVTPGIIGFFGAVPAAGWSDLLVGIGVAALSVWALLGAPSWTDWGTLALGIYLLVSPFLWGFHGHGADNTIATWFGLAISVLSVWGLFQPLAEPATGEPVFKAAMPSKEELERRMREEKERLAAKRRKQ